MESDQPNIVARTPAQLGHAIQRFRWLRSLSQAELGNRASLRQPTISDLEKGKGRIKTLTEVLSALDLELIVRPKQRTTDSDLEDLI